MQTLSTKHRPILIGITLLSLAVFVGYGVYIVANGGKIDDGHKIWAALALGASALAGLGGLTGLLGMWTRESRTRRDAQYEKEVAEVKERMAQSQHADASWELARVKLESYLNRNLDQVRAIFWLSAVLMTAGFLLIMFSVWLMLQGKADSAMVGAGSGVLVEFIGASLMKLYQSIMGQARRYVQVLERINAVGMAVRILDRIDKTEHEVKQQALVEVSRSLLAMYASQPTEAAEPEPPKMPPMTEQLGA